MLRYTLVLALLLAPAAYPQTVLLGGMGFDDDVVDYGTSLNAALAEDFTLELTLVSDDDRVRTAEFISNLSGGLPTDGLLGNAAFNGTWTVEYILNHSYLLTGDRVVVGANVGPSLAVKTDLSVDYTDVGGGGRTLVEMTLRLDDVLADAAQMEIPTSAVTVSPDRLTVGAGWQFGGVYAGHFSGTLGEVVLRLGADLSVGSDPPGSRSRPDDAKREPFSSVSAGIHLSPGAEKVIHGHFTAVKVSAQDAAALARNVERPGGRNPAGDGAGSAPTATAPGSAVVADPSEAERLEGPR